MNEQQIRERTNEILSSAHVNNDVLLEQSAAAARDDDGSDPMLPVSRCITPVLAHETQIPLTSNSAHSNFIETSRLESPEHQQHENNNAQHEPSDAHAGASDVSAAHDDAAAADTSMSVPDVAMSMPSTPIQLPNDYNNAAPFALDMPNFDMEDADTNHDSQQRMPTRINNTNQQHSSSSANDTQMTMMTDGATHEQTSEQHSCESHTNEAQVTTSRQHTQTCGEEEANANDSEQNERAAEAQQQEQQQEQQLARLSKEKFLTRPTNSTQNTATSHLTPLSLSLPLPLTAHSLSHTHIVMPLALSLSVAHDTAALVDAHVSVDVGESAAVPAAAVSASDTSVRRTGRARNFTKPFWHK